MLNSRIQEKRVKTKDGKIHSYVYVIVDYTENGKRCQKPYNTGMSISELHRGGKRKVEKMQIEFAKQWEDKLAKKRGMDINFANLTVMQMLQKYADDRKIERNLSDQVYENYVTTYPNKMREFLRKRGKENMKLADFTWADAEAFMDSVWKQKNQRTNETLSPNTIKHIVNFFKPAFKYAKKKKFVTHNAFEDVTAPKIPIEKPEFFTNEEFDILWNALENEEVGLAIQFAMWTGMRRSEVVGLKHKAIDYANNAIVVREKVLRKKGEGLKCYKELKTKYSKRSIPLSLQAQAVLAKQAKSIEENSKRLLYDHTDSEYVFVDNNGKLVKPDRLTNTVKRLCDKYGIEGHLHKMRHTFATRLRKAGADVKIIQDTLGHADPNITLKYYMGTDETDKRVAVDKMSQQFANQSKTPDLRITK
jgi:integrase